MFSGPFHESSQELQVQGGTIVRVAKTRKLAFLQYGMGEVKMLAYRKPKKPWPLSLGVSCGGNHNAQVTYGFHDVFSWRADNSGAMSERSVKCNIRL